MNFNSPLLIVSLTLITAVVSLPSFVIAQDGEWGNLKGSFILKGDPPELPPLVVDKDKATCLIDGKPPENENLIVGDNGELKDVYVMMYFKKGDDKRPAIHPDYVAAKSEPVEIDNQLCRFVPHAVFVQTGQTFTLKNTDDVGHNTHITCFNNEENINLPAGGSVDVTMKKAEKAPGNITCDIHKWMSAVVLIRDEPYAAISDDDGTFQLDNIPAGTWQFQFWHKKSGYLRKLEIPGYKVGRKGEIEVTIKNGETLDLGQMMLPAEAIKK